MRLTPYGLRECIVITLLAVIAAGVLIWLGWYWPLVIVGIVWLALLAFFRDPKRAIPIDLKPGDMLSPADGRVSKVFRVDHHEATNGPAQVIRIFLSVLDVHVNRSPFDGEVVALKHSPGKYYDARSEKSAELNESNLITIRIAHGRDARATDSGGGGGGETIGVRQVSGAIARRIVCPLKVGDRLKRGERFGMIKFGSTTELILPRPDDVIVHVRAGDTVRGGLTVLATLRM